MQPTQPRHAIHLGAAWEPPEAHGDRVHLVRQFGRPSGLEPGDRVLLVIDAAAVRADVWLNAAPLPSLAAGAGRWTHDITPLLRDRNALTLAIAADAMDRVVPGRGRPPAAIGIVTIEIVAGG